MIHVFTYHEHYYIYDTGSGSLHECDEKTAAYLKGEPTELTDEELKNVVSDVEGLKEAGLLYKEEPKAYPVKSRRSACISATTATCAAATALRTRGHTIPRAR